MSKLFYNALWVGFRYNGIGSGNSTSKNITNHYGLYLANVDKAQNNYAIYTNAGKVRFGDNVETTGTIKVETTTDNTCDASTAGIIRFNSTDKNSKGVMELLG